MFACVVPACPQAALPWAWNTQQRTNMPCQHPFGPAVVVDGDINPKPSCWPAGHQLQVTLNNWSITRRCMAAPQRQRQQAEAPELSAAASLALSSLLVGGAPAWADEAAAAAGEAEQVVTGIAPAGWALILSPIIFYGLFNVYRSQVGSRHTCRMTHIMCHMYHVPVHARARGSHRQR